MREDSRDYLRQALGNEAFQLEYSAGTRLTFDRRRRAGTAGNALDGETSQFRRCVVGLGMIMKNAERVMHPTAEVVPTG